MSCQVQGSKSSALLLLILGCSESSDMITVPAGNYLMGCDRSRDESCSDQELPASKQNVVKFQIDKTEVTQQDYQSCIDVKVCTQPAADFDPQKRPKKPVTHVTWKQADTYCRWAKKRLPTEIEWEFAARGSDGRIYPWGDQPPDCNKAHLNKCGSSPADAGGRQEGASPFGVLDMAGNVDEWVADDYAAYQTKAIGAQKVARGGAYDAWHSRSTARNALQPEHHDALLGFRCAQN